MMMASVSRFLLGITIIVGGLSAARAQTIAALGMPLNSKIPEFRVPGAVDSPVTPAVRPSSSIEPPTDPVQRAAFMVLQTHCARCHQSGQLVGIKKPAKGMGNILNLEELAANKKYVKPGDAEGSLLYHVVVVKDMPYDIFQDFDYDHPYPHQSDLDALKAWIVSLESHAPVADAAKALQVASVDVKSSEVKQSAVLSELALSSDKLATGAIVSRAMPGSAAAKDDNQRVASVEPATRNDAAPIRTLRADEVQALADQQAMVRDAQEKLAKLGCFTGTVSGVEDSDTTSAIGRFNDKAGRRGAGTMVSASLVGDLETQTYAICRDPAPARAEPTAPTARVEPEEDTADETAAPVEHRTKHQHAVTREPTRSPPHAAKKPEVASAPRQAPWVVQREAPHRNAERAPPAARPRVAIRAPRSAPVERHTQSSARAGGGGGDTISGVNGI